MITQKTNLKSLLIEGYFGRLSKKCPITTNSGPGPLRPRGHPPALPSLPLVLLVLLVYICATFPTVNGEEDTMALFYVIKLPGDFVSILNISKGVPL